MSLSVIPLLMFSAFMIFSYPGKSGTTAQQDAAAAKQARLQQESEAKDYDTIYNYISKKYKKINEDDAHNITENLVKYGKKYDLDPKLAAALIERESSFNKEAVSSTGAKGLGQIKDFNYKDLNIENPFDIKENVDGTVNYLKKMIKQWKSAEDHTKRGLSEDNDKSDVELALASYYKGFTAVKQQGVDETTEAYVDDIIEGYQEIANSSK